MNSPPNNAAKEKVLVYLFGSLGDNIAAIPTMRAVRRHFAGAEIVVLQNIQSAMPVRAEEVIPPELVDRYLTYTSDVAGFGKLGHLFGLWRQLRSEKFDAAVYAIISERPESSVERDIAFFRRCGIQKLYGFHAFSRAELFPFDSSGRAAIVPHEADRRLERIARDGIETETTDISTPLLDLSEDEIRKAGSWLMGRRKASDAKLLAIAPGCKTKANQWPEERFAILGQRLEENGFEIVVVGGRAEREMAARLGFGINAAGEFSVRRSAAILSLCDAYIGLDTGTTHLAAAVGTPCFSIYGERNNQGQWFPLGNGNLTLFHGVECAGCRHEICPLSDHPCIRGIEVDNVWPHLQEFLATLDEKRSSRVIEV